MNTVCENSNVSQDPSLHRDEYESLLEAQQADYALSAGQPLFVTDADGDALWEAYLSGFSHEDRQHHNCNTCRKFIQRYGRVVFVDGGGHLWPTLFDGERNHHSHYNEAIRAVHDVVRKAKITSGFKSETSLIGEPETGPWSHFHIRLRPEHVEGANMSHAHYAIRTRENFKTVSRFIGETEKDIVSTAVTMLMMDTLYRSEKVLGAAEWLLRMYDVIRNRNLFWVEIAKAPEGFCHPRASVIGSLIEDIEAGYDLDTVKRRFDDKMNPLKYQRPQAPPKAGAIDQAEKLFKELGLESALQRRFARVEEVDAIWRPKAQKEKGGGGVFDVVRAKNRSGGLKQAQPITGERFISEVLPVADSIHVQIPGHTSDFVGILTAADPDAKPILQWDPAKERRNPFSWFRYAGGSFPSHWGLRGHNTVGVTAVVRHTATWWGGELKNHGDAIVFLLDGIRHQGMEVSGLFPEILKSELHGVRSVIEAYSNKVPATGEETGTACGIAAPCVVDVTVKGGVTVRYNIDRMK